AARKPPPLTFAQHLQKTLIPARALLDERADRNGSLLSGDRLRVIGDCHTCTPAGQSHADLAILGQTLPIPTAPRPPQLRAGENGIPAKRNEPFLRMEMQTGAEPEVILQTVARRPPTRVDVHQLHARLDHICAGLLEPRFDQTQQPRMYLVLGVKDTDD